MATIIRQPYRIYLQNKSFMVNDNLIPKEVVVEALKDLLAEHKRMNKKLISIGRGHDDSSESPAGIAHLVIINSEKK